ARQRRAAVRSVARAWLITTIRISLLFRTCPISKYLLTNRTKIRYFLSYVESNRTTRSPFRRAKALGSCNTPLPWMDTRHPRGARHDHRSASQASQSPAAPSDRARERRSRRHDHRPASRARGGGLGLPIGLHPHSASASNRNHRTAGQG